MTAPGETCRLSPRRRVCHPRTGTTSFACLHPSPGLGVYHGLRRVRLPLQPPPHPARRLPLLARHRRRPPTLHIPNVDLTNPPPFISFSSPTARRRSGARSARGAGVIRRQSTRGLRVTGHLFQARFGSVAMDEGRHDDGGAHCGFEPRAGTACQTGGRLALVERCRRAQ
jgi:hypothetical protein